MKHRITKQLLFLIVWLSLIPGFSFASNWPTWTVWLAEFKKEAIANGINSAFFDQVFQHITPNKRVINFDRKQPEKRLTFLQYRTTRADNFRIKLGRQEFAKNREVIDEVSKHFGVDPCFIASIWGMETSYGRYMGKFPVISSLATLAYDPRRSQFFRKELLIALQILQEGHITQDEFQGEWAGASGQAQFLPSSWKKYAVDYDKDGKKNIWTSLPDAFASIGNYLAQNGWHINQPWAIEVDVPSGFSETLIDNNVKKTVAEWKTLGVHPKNGKLPNEKMTAGLVKPYDGPVFLVFNNFHVLQQYNRSIFYVGTIGYLADQICKR